MCALSKLSGSGLQANPCNKQMQKLVPLHMHCTAITVCALLSMLSMSWFAPLCAVGKIAGTQKWCKQRTSCLQFAEEEDGEPVTAAAPKKDKVPYDQTIVNVDSEHSLVVVRASGGSTTVAMGPNSMAAQVAIGAFEIEDLLVGAVCLENSYLARSSLPAKEKFHDASSELTSMQRAPSEDSTASSKEEFHDAPDDLPASGQQQQISSQALVMQYNKWTPQSSEYHDVDAQVHVKLKTLSFFCNRPTLGALMAIGDDVSATGAAKPPDAPAAAVQQPSPQEDEEQEALEPTVSNADKGKLCHAMRCITLDLHASIV